MKDEKEEFINNVAIKLELPREEVQKVKNLLFMELYNYSLIKIQNTDVAIYEENVNEEAVRMFFVAKNIQGCTKRTLEYYRSVISAFLNFLQNKPVTSITTNDIRYYLAVKKERDNNSDPNVDNIRRTLSSFFAWLMEEEYITKNPIVKIKKVRQEKYVKKAFKDTEIEKLRYEINNIRREDMRIRFSALLEVLLSTGCRISEVSTMNRDNLDGDEIIVKGKGKKERIVYLNAKARMALDVYLKSRADNNPAMFVTLDKPYNRWQTPGMGADIRELGRNAGVPDVHPHRFRRTAATMALNRGMPIDQVQIMLGHSNIQTTTIYAVSAQETVKANHKKYVV